MSDISATPPEADVDYEELKRQKETELRCSELLEKASQLMTEVEEFRKYVASRKQTKLVEFRHFRGAVEAELKTLQKVCQAVYSLLHMY